MIHTGLVSVTLRKLLPQAIIELVVQADLEGIEWGGDVHVPQGDLDQARRVRRATEEAGTAIAAYGSYYRVGYTDPALFEPTLETAVGLGAPTIRVWAGRQGSDVADEAYRNHVAADTRRIADMAAEAGVTVAFEAHLNTLTDTALSAKRLMEAIDHPNVGAYWQPLVGETFEQSAARLDAVLPWLAHVHVQSRGCAGEKLCLSETERDWQVYLQKIASTGRDHFALIEFVQDGTQENVIRDAAVLRRWVSSQARGKR